MLFHMCKKQPFQSNFMVSGPTATPTLQLDFAAADVAAERPAHV